MSGILGVYALSGEPADAALLMRMCAKLSHRGGNGHAVWADANVGLGLQFRSHRSTADALHEIPSFSDCRIVFDGRLDDRENLRKTLGVSESEWLETTDSLAVLKTYVKFEEKFIGILHGDFAFGLWDRRRRRFICARDRIGVRPFYYHLSPKHFFFASEIKALLECKEISRELDGHRVANYIHARFEDKESTFYRQIKRLPPAETLVINGHQFERKKYWSLCADISHKSETEHVSEFISLMQASVSDRLHSAESTGFLLSGGIDSSSVLAWAQEKLNGAKPNAFLATFPDFPHIDEQRWVDRLKGQYAFDLHPVRVDHLGPVEMMNEIYQWLDEPFHFPNLYIYWALGKRARDQGVSVLLDGMDGDTTVSHGMEYLAELVRTGRFLELARHVRRISRKFQLPAWGFLFHFGLVPVLRQFAPPGFSPSRILNPEFAHQINWEEQEAAHRQTTLARSMNAASQHRAQLESGIIPYHLEVYDQAAAALGLDHRHPYYDSRLVQFCVSVPPEQKIAGGLDRSIQRRALKGVIPDEIRLRMSKSNWEANFERSFLQTDGQKLEEMLSTNARLRDFVSVSSLKTGLARMRRETRLRSKSGMYLWTAASFGKWLDTCYEKP